MGEFFQRTTRIVQVPWLDRVSYRAGDWIIHTKNCTLNQVDSTGWIPPKPTCPPLLSLLPSYY